MKRSKVKVGVVSCSGEDYPEGTISRIATRLIIDKIRPGQTTTICLPLFLCGGENERAFARDYPTITVDGCSKRCAERSTRKYSGAPAASIIVSEIAKKYPFLKLDDSDEVGSNGMKLAEKVADEIAHQIDKIIEQS
ncbi:MAG: putative zinc-binding protein [Candidatus Ranarchaeia archaeon]